MRQHYLPIGLVSIVAFGGLLLGGAPGCSSEAPLTVSQASRAAVVAAVDVPVLQEARRLDAERFRREFQRIEHDHCVVIIPPPRPWAVNPDGSHKLPSEIHRRKAGGEQILYLNFEGPHMEPAWQDDPENNASSVLMQSGQARDLPVFDDVPFQRGTLDTRKKVIDVIRRWATYFYAHMPVKVVTERPAAGTEYTMMVVGGKPGDIGESPGVLGIATADCDKDPTNVGYAFAEDHGSNLGMLVQTIVHEAGHTFGLMHIDDSSGIMYWAQSGTTNYWSAGSTTDTQGCDNSGYQDSIAVLQVMLGIRPDVVPPWLELLTVGTGAVTEPSFQVLVHGVDNVVLWEVELFVDGASQAVKTLPEFAFDVAALPNGPHQLWAVGEDAHGNTFSSEPVEITVEANCGALAQCEDGLAPVGAPCEDGRDCQTGLCAEAVTGIRVCAKPCSADEPCPSDTECVGDPEGDPTAETYCAGGPGPITLHVFDEGGGYALSGCATGGGAPWDGAGAGLVIVLLAMVLGWRRRR